MFQSGEEKRSGDKYNEIPGKTAHVTLMLAQDPHTHMQIHTCKTIRLMTWAKIEAEAVMGRGPTAEQQEKKHLPTKHLKG